MLIFSEVYGVVTRYFNFYMEFGVFRLGSFGYIRAVLFFYILVVTWWGVVVRVVVWIFADGMFGVVL